MLRTLLSGLLLRKMLSGWGSALSDKGWVLLMAAALALLFIGECGAPAKHTTKTIENVVAEGPRVPDHDREDGRGPGLTRGPSAGATANKALPRPTSFMLDRGYKYNFYPISNWSGRGVNPIEAIVVHVTGPGTCPGMRSWFNNPASQASAHFGVCQDGSLEQYVELADVAWHAGILNRPQLNNGLIASWVNGGVNPNSRTVGIELQLTPGQLLGDFPKMAQTFDDLMLWLLQALNLPADRVHIMGHFEIDSVNRAVDPVCCVNLDMTAGYAAARLAPPPPPPPPPVDPAAPEVTLGEIVHRVGELERRVFEAGIP